MGALQSSKRTITAASLANKFILPKNLARLGSSPSVVSRSSSTSMCQMLTYLDNKNNRAANFRSRKSTPILTIPFAFLDSGDTLKVSKTLVLQPNASLSFQIVTGSSET